MRFDLTDLQLFAHIAETGSITAGAARSHMTLASASQRVRGMEERLGAPLLLRGRQGVQVTEAGRTLLHHARLVLQQMERLRGELGDYGAGLHGHIRLLCNTSAMAEHLPAPLAAFLRQHPQLSIDLDEQPSAQIVEAVRDGLCDIGIVSDAVDAAGLRSFVFRRDDLVLVVPRGHAFARRRRVAFDELAGQSFVGLAADSPLQALVTQQARRLGQRLVYRVRVRHFEAVCSMVGQGIGIGIVPQAAAQRLAASLSIVGIGLAEPWAERQLLLCVRDEGRLPMYAQRLLDHLVPTKPEGPG
ncbi:LysR family transcriptional regulator [Rhodoferax koreense]|uniref:LysR family transcriptional regulator n=1 Tax=Rhodoferax koreensis TaxID=1842727 RepID=A0A1P8JYA0_9BURK|nr:LysR family transcriptional regulator [Rhodoferax koreense]APW38661.1 LysR family transcriptional regulator [Rhodoferax koreense]